MPGRGETQDGLASRAIAAGRSMLADGGAALPAWPLLGLLCAVSAAMIVVLGTRLTFFNDEWFILLQRPGLNAHSVLDPHNEHLIALPVLIYKALIGVFGFEHQLPYRLLLAGVFVVLGVVVFLFVRERAGQLLALVAAALLLFLGPTWENLLWSFQIGFVGSLATGVGVLLALEVDTARRNAVACALLVCGILLSDLGIPFVIAAVVAVLLRRRPAQLWIPGIPTLLFAAWWLGYGHTAESHFSLGNVARTPLYLFNSAASGLSSLAGLDGHSLGTLDTYSWGRPLLAVVIVAVAVWLLRGGRPSRYTWVIASAALAFWLLAGFNFVAGREPVAGRYQLVDATFLILIAAELFRPIRLRPGALAAIAGVAVVCVGANLGVLGSGYDFMRNSSALTRADLGALEIGRGHMPPDFQLLEDVGRSPHLSGVTAGAYYRETEAHGLPPLYSPERLATVPPDLQQAADNVLAAGYRMHLESAEKPSGGSCRRLPAAFNAGPRDLALPAGGATITNLGGGAATIGVRRFAPAANPINLGFLASGYSARIDIPTDSVARPWHLVASGPAGLDVCR